MAKIPGDTSAESAVQTLDLHQNGTSINSVVEIVHRRVRSDQNWRQRPYSRYTTTTNTVLQCLLTQTGGLSGGIRRSPSYPLQTALVIQLLQDRKYSQL